MTNNPTIDGVSLKRDDKLFHRGNGWNCDRGWVEYIRDEGCGEVRVRHRNGAVPVVKLSNLQWQAMTDEEELEEFYSELSNGGKLSKRALCHIRALQSTIAQLQARVAELESGRGEPVAYADPIAFENFKNHAHKGGHWDHEWMWAQPDSRMVPLFTAPPAPIAVLLPERDLLRDKIAEAIGGDTYDCTRVWSAWGAGTMDQDDFVPLVDQEDRLYEIVDACLDATAALDGVDPK